MGSTAGALRPSLLTRLCSASERALQPRAYGVRPQHLAHEDSLHPLCVIARPGCLLGRPGRAGGRRLRHSPVGPCSGWRARAALIVYITGKMVLCGGPRAQEFLRLADDLVAGQPTPPGPPPPDLLPRQWSFLGPVVLDTVPHGAPRALLRPWL